MQKDYNYFKLTEIRINKRLNRVREVLTQYKNEAEKIKGQWNEEHRHRFKNWNRLHDIETLLEFQLKNNYFEYQNFCFDNYGVSVYNLSGE